MNPVQTQQQNCHDWIEFFTRLHAEGVPSMEQLVQITSPHIRFRDPFNDLQGRDALRALLAHTREQIADVRFQVLDTAASGRRVYLKWEMSGRLRLLGDWKVTGMTELEFDSDGRLLLHQDHWDASEQFYFRLPIIGWVLRRIRQAAAVRT